MSSEPHLRMGPIQKEQVQIPQLLEKKHISSCTATLMAIAAIVAVGTLITAPMIGAWTLGPAACIAGNMTMTVPFFVITGAGLVATGYLAVQLKRHGNRMLQLWVTRNPEAYQAWRGRFMFRNRRPDRVSVEQAEARNFRHRERTLLWLGGSQIARTVKIETDNGKLDAVWSRIGDSSERPTAIVFHGQEGTLDYMYRWGNWYHRMGMNVLMVSAPGYGCSEGDPRVEEALGEAAYNALQFVRNQQAAHTVIAHGYSMGGVMATALGEEDEVQLVTADHAFDKLENAASNKARSYRVIPDSTVRMLAQTLFPIGMNNLKYIRNECTAEPMKANLHILYGENDKVTGKGEAARNLRNARYASPYTNDGAAEQMCQIAGGHNAFKNFFYPGDLQIDGEESFVTAPAGDPRQRLEGRSEPEAHYIARLQALQIIQRSAERDFANGV